MTIEEAHQAMRSGRKVAHYQTDSHYDIGKIVQVTDLLAFVQWEFWGVCSGIPLEQLEFERTVQ